MPRAATESLVTLPVLCSWFWDSLERTLSPPVRSGRCYLGVPKAEIKTFDLRIGVVSHTLLSTKIRRGKVYLLIALCLPGVKTVVFVGSLSLKYQA